MIVSVYLPHNDLGEFIRGSIFLYKFAKSLKQEFDINFKYSNFDNYLLNKYDYFFTKDDIIFFNKNNIDFIKQQIKIKPIVYINSIDKVFDIHLPNDIK